MEVSSNSPLIKSFAAALFLHLLFFSVMFTVFPEIKVKVIKPAELALDFVQETIQKKIENLPPQKEVLPAKKQVIPKKRELEKKLLPIKKIPLKIKQETTQPQEQIAVPEEIFRKKPQPIKQEPVPEASVKKANQQKNIDNFLAEILMRIEKAKYYPSVARKKGMTGTITCKFSIFANGSVNNISLVKSSKYKLLNKAAVDAIKKGAPYPDFPSSFKENIFTSHVDIKFYLN